MKKMKRILISGVAAMLTAASLVGTTSCSFGNKPTNDQVKVDVVAYDGSDVTVTFYHTMGANLSTVLKDHITEFNKLYPKIKIEQKTQGNYDALHEMLNTRMNGGLDNLPTMAYCYADHVASYNASQAVVTLDDYLYATNLTVTRADGTTETMGMSATQIKDYVEAYYEEGRKFGDNKMYMLPFAKSTEVLFYNKTFFDANNLTVPTSWTEMEAMCETIKGIDADCIPLGYDSEANWFITMCEQYGSGYTSMDEGNHFIFNNDTNKAFVKEIKEWYDKNYVTTKEAHGSYTSDLFTSGECYMSIGSTGGTGYNIPGLSEGDGASAAFEVGIAPIPQVSTDATKHKVISQGPSICFFKKDAQEVAAGWLFLKYLTTSLEFQAEFSMTSGYAPVINSVEEFPAYKTFLENAGKGNAYLKATSVKQNIAQKNACYVSYAFNGSSNARQEVGNLMLDVMLGTPGKNQSMDDFIAEKFDDAMRVLNKYN